MLGKFIKEKSYSGIFSKFFLNTIPKVFLFWTIRICWNQWFIKKAQLETPRKILHDAGIGLISFAVTFIIFCFVYDFPLRKARTPNRKRSFMLIYLLALAIQVPNSMFYFSHRLMRFEYPPWGDSIFIGIFHTALACVIFGRIGLLVFRDILRKTLFPADIYIWSKSNPVFSSVITAIFGILALLCMFRSPIQFVSGVLAA